MKTNIDLTTIKIPDDQRSADVMKPSMIVTFWLGTELFGVDIEWVQEMLRSQEITPIPLAPEYVAGLINLRGQIIMALHLKKLINNQTPAFNPNPDSMNLIVRHNEDVVSLLIDDVGDVLELNPTDMRSVPPTLTTIKSEYLYGVYPLNTHLLLVLNMERVLTLQ
ncbi:MAG: chemotaxis protein CheW [candidate division KSB1 bacterium]|nr:chemotaxis protein CheW [candidate division KSB1 bacterium]